MLQKTTRKIFRITERGFTFVELVIIIGIFLTLLGIALIGTSQLPTRASLSSLVVSLETDIKSQQLKAMVRDRQSAAQTTSYGIYFSSSSYTLFQGDSYNPASTSNITVPLDSSITFSAINLPSNTVVFSIGNGEVSNFDQARNTFTMRNNNTNEQKTLTINRRGTIISSD